MSKSTFFLVLVLLPGNVMYAQTASNQNNSDLKKATTDLKKSVQGIGQLFKKKKADTTASTTNSSVANNGSQPGMDSKTANNQPTGKNSISHGLKAGEILTGAKFIDADDLSPFNEGAAVIRKGNAYAMIDTKANLIIPFNVYSHLSFGPVNNYGYTNKFNGIFSYTKSNGENGFLNAEGKVLAITYQTGKNASYTDINSMIMINAVSK